MSRPIARIAPLIAAALLTVARPAPAADDLPKGEAVIDQYIEATGGKAAYEKLKNRVATGTLEIVGAGVKGKLSTVEAEPNKSKLTIDFGEQIGKQTEGSDGQVFWESSPFQGDRVIEGEEKVDKANDALFNGEIKYKQRYSKIEVVGVEDVEGKPAYKVVLTPKTGGKTSTEYYDKASHLLVKSVKTQKSPQAEITAEQYPGDYKKVDGILYPHSAKIKVAAQELVITFSEIKHNVDLPADAFALPDAIKALAEKKDK